MNWELLAAVALNWRSMVAHCRTHDGRNNRELQPSACNLDLLSIGFGNRLATYVWVCKERKA